jgi:hypothetical protein
MSDTHGMSDPHDEARRRTPFVMRMVRAAALDAAVYEEVEHDKRAMPQAAVVVLLAALGGGIGGIENAGLIGVAVTAAAVMVGWVGWAWITCVIGTMLLPQPQTEADHGELLRTIGFSASPGCLAVLGVVPGLNPWLYGVIGIWLLMAMVVAVRQALDYHRTFRAVLVCAIGFPVSIILLALSFLVMGPWPI